MGVYHLLKAAGLSVSDHGKNKTASREYRGALEKYAAAVKQSKQTAAENQVKIASYEQELQVMQRRIKDSTDTLARFTPLNWNT